jgi:hypothetical protein
MPANADTGRVIPLTACPVCYGYRLKLHRVTGDLLAVVRVEYAAHLEADHALGTGG